MRFRNFVGLMIAATFLYGCGGTMQGAVRGTGEQVQFTYEQGVSSDNLTAVVSGETFRGKAVMRGATATSGTTFGTFYGNGGSASGFGTFSGTTTTGDVVATLLGSRGSSLSCDLQYADPSGFTTAGGVGVCRHSDGRIIDVIW